MTTDPSPRRTARRMRSLIAGLALLAVVAIPLRRAAALAADPVGLKDCGPEDDPSPGASGSSTGAVDASALPWSQRGGSINDFSCLNRTPIRGILEIRTEDDVRSALAFAAEQNLKVSVAGVRHSQGGQAFAPGAIVLDMRAFNRITLDAERRVVRVQSGATWHAIQEVLHPRFAVRAMQSTDIFTVGGSIAVNAHGMDHRAGSVGRTLRSMRVMLADGSIRTVSRDENTELFRHVLGGYGLFGVILDAELDITDNVVYESERRVLDYRDLVTVLERDVEGDPAVGLAYAHLSTSPDTLLRDTLLYTYRQVAQEGLEVPPLGEVSQVKLRRLVFNLSKRGGAWMRLKWLAEKHLEPRLESCPVTRNEALRQGEACLVSRNDPMHDSVPYLMNALPEETDILHEYFVPRASFVAFVDGLRQAVRDEGANLLNASVRVVHREDMALNYAPQDGMLAVVLYLNQPTTAPGTEQMSRLTGRLIDLSTKLNGTFFLPYQLHYGKEQLAAAYPDVGAFFDAKRRFDPGERLSSTFYERFGRQQF
jgi:FAD/FMN-containing dehydrogenase